MIGLYLLVYLYVLRKGYFRLHRSTALLLIAVPFLNIVLSAPTEIVSSYDMEQTFEFSAERNLLSLYKAYEDDFEVGISVPLYALENEEMSWVINRHFKSITAEETMKPEYILDEQNRGAYHFSKSDPYVEYAEKHDKALRGHTLVWYNQTPDWFFKEDFQDDGELVKRATMLKRLEEYIEAVLTRYEDSNLYAWDVVNEGMEIFSETGYRNSYWLEIIGPDYIEKAFEYARKYSEGTGIKLFYNDFNIFSNDKKRTLVYDVVKNLKEKDLIDGIGIQTHVGLTLPLIKDIDETLQLFEDLNLEIQITELDVTYYNTNNALTDTADANKLMEQAARYNDLFDIFKKYGTSISSVTFWGMADHQSWLNFYPTNRNNWPLLFDRHLHAKPAFYSILGAEKIELTADYSLYERLEKSINVLLDID